MSGDSFVGDFLKMSEALIECVGRYDPDFREDRLRKACEFAKTLHQHQKRASGEPYFTHPLAVAQILADLKLDSATIITALLHDTVEDTRVTLEDIQEVFGSEIAFLVDGVTKLSCIANPDFSWLRHAEDLRKFLLAVSKDIRVLFVKLADRLHNMQTLHYLKKPEKRYRISQETMNIYVPLTERVGLITIKEALADLAFYHLNPGIYEAILSRLKEVRGTPVNFIPMTEQELFHLFSHYQMDVSLKGREKSVYSIWEKMTRKKAPFEQISDIMAFRVTVATIPECYTALGILHTAYRMIPGKFKDYISTPKPNDYQGLHTTLIGPSQKRIEVQIQTYHMLRVAEYGVAAHWRYKQELGPNHRKSQWLKDLLDILDQSSDSEEFFEHTRLELFQDQVFCLTPKGDVVNLPKGATPIDFAYAVNTRLGDSCKGVRINGVPMPLNTVLSNGDQVYVVTCEPHGPSIAWAKFVVTGKARSHIKRFIYEQRREFVELGQNILRRVAQEKNRIFLEEVLAQHVTIFDCAQLDDLYAAVGKGVFLAEEVIQAAFGGTALSPSEGNVDSGQEKIPSAPSHTLSQRPSMVSSFVKSQDLIMQKKPLYEASLRIFLIQKAGGIEAVTQIITQAKGQIHDFKVCQQPLDYAEIYINLSVKSPYRLDELAAALRLSSWVLEVERCGGK